MTFDPSASLIPYCNRTAVGFPHYPVGSDSEPEPYYAPRNIPRPISSTFQRLRNERLKCERNLGWNLDFAVAFVINHLEESPDVAESLKSLRISAAKFCGAGHPLELAHRAFNRLDQILFAGHLRDAVFLDLGNLGTHVSGVTSSHGQGPNPRVRRISIVLNANLLQRTDSKNILATLIHHMIHAYFLVACGRQDDRIKEEYYNRLAHGLHYGKVMNAIKKVSGHYGRPFPLGFGHNLLGRYYNEYHPSPPRHRQKHYRSQCYCDVDPISEPDINEWYEGVCKPMLEHPDFVQKPAVWVYNSRRGDLEEILREESTPSPDAVEFILTDKAVQVPGDKIDNYLSIRKAFDRAGSRLLKVHEDIRPETFLALLELLHTDNYSPDIQPVVGSGRKGPPVIRPMHTESPVPYLLTDIRMFKLGDLMGFEDVKALAIHRMKAQTTTNEDPISFLRELYVGGEPAPDLREWACKFLVRMPDDDDAGLGLGLGLNSANGAMGNGGSGLSNEPPNLVKLQEDMGFKARFYQLVEQSGALAFDVLKAREEIWRVVRGRVWDRRRRLGRGALGREGEGEEGLGWEWVWELAWGWAWVWGVQDI
ncbi:hypothetical protein P154DRAFT_535145 [Amniculicola lignicola CBS 123094]|uniref:SprT-like domain-containing protein n=1 Tax=Amniculicola lignicola CBS 123094 TaxID=1392246 RepID=A0A6A5WDE1_9PLEO|nr:hypothetical protein P154DRAFT_535145 [Amniculicola lignicola CBS 123094]